MYEVMLTTVDNPWDYFTQFNDWWKFDHDHDYGCCEILARLASTSEDFTPEENAYEIEKAVDRFVATDPFNIYKKVKRKIEGDIYLHIDGWDEE